MKRRFNTFILTLKRSLVDPSYYKDVVVAPFGFSLKYLYFLFFVIALITSIVIATEIVVLIPDIPKFKAEATSYLTKLYPEELIVTVQDGKLSSNVKEPYFFTPPKFVEDSQDTITSLAIIDTQALIEDYPSYKTIFLLTETSIVVPDDNSGFKVYPLTDVENFTMDVDMYDEMLETLLPYLDFLPTVAFTSIILVILILPFIIAASSLLGRLIYLLLVALIMWIFAKVLSVSLTYTSVYKISMHTLTYTVILAALLGLFGVGLTFWPYLAISLLTTGFVIVKTFRS